MSAVCGMCCARKLPMDLVGGVIEFDPVCLECFIPSCSKCGDRSWSYAEAESRICLRTDSALGIGILRYESDEKKPGKLCEICASKRLCKKCGGDLPLNAFDKYPRGKRRAECEKCKAKPGQKALRECKGCDKWLEAPAFCQHGNRARRKKCNPRRRKAKRPRKR